MEALAWILLIPTTALALLGTMEPIVKLVSESEDFDICTYLSGLIKRTVNSLSDITRLINNT